MTREIKFRAWDEENNKMVTPCSIEFESTAYGIGQLEEKYYELMQFTGLHDKNGKEIYEGDIVKIPDDYEEYGFMAGEEREVYYCDGCFRLKPKHEHVIKRGDRGNTIADDMDLCEIIGNIYENPELLK